MVDSAQRSRSSRSSAWQAIGESVRDSGAAILFLASAVSLMASMNWHILPESHMMRMVYWLEAKGPSWLGLQYVQRRFPEVPPARTITVLELSPNAFELDFGRRSPTERGCIAAALEELAKRLENTPPPGGFAVVAIDIDITLTGGETYASQSADPQSCLDQPLRINTALTALRQHATIIALAVERRDPGGRTGRNKFIAKNCSDTCPASPTKRDGGLYFASAAAFSRATDAVYETPTRRKASGTPRADAIARVDLPAIYPSLGNLLAIARKGNDTARLTEQEKESLTAMCSAAQKKPSPGRSTSDVYLLDDLVLGGASGASADEVARRYKFDLLNFLVAETRLRMVPVDRIADIANSPILSPTIILSLTDGSTADRFVTPHNAEDFSPGAWVHGVTAASLEGALDKPSYAFKWLADLVAGVLFAALAFPLVLLRECKSPAAPFLRRSATLLLPLVCAGAVILVGALFSAWLLSWGLWFNPLYMALGMAVHSYFEASHAVPREANTASTDGRKREATSTLGSLVETVSGLLDVEDAPPREKRSPWDLASVGLWAMLYIAIVVAALWIVGLDGYEWLKTLLG